MTASVGFAEDYTLGDELMLRYRQSTGWAPGVAGDGLYAFLCGLPHDDCSHGDRYRYRSPNTDVLGWICERVSGTSFADALSHHVWIPMGAESDAEVTIDGYGAARAAGGLSTGARDLARVGQLVADGGGDVVPEWFIEDLFTAGDEVLFAAGDLAEYFPRGTAYRSCWYAYGPEQDSVGALGIHGQMIYVDRPTRVVVAKQSTWPEPDEDPSFKVAEVAADALVRALSS